MTEPSFKHMEGSTRPNVPIKYQGDPGIHTSAMFHACCLFPLAQVLEQQSPSTGDDPREPPSPRLNSSKVVHKAPSATQLPGSSSSSSCKALQGKDAVSKLWLHKLFHKVCTAW